MTLTPDVNLAGASLAGNLLEDIIFSIVGYTWTTEQVGHDGSLAVTGGRT